MLRLAPQHAWTYSRGGGVMVAIVDSGVDASLPALAGRVTEGADIIAGTGRGNTDCVGSGTAMAGIVAARSENGEPLGGGAGIAPEATVMPVRVAPTNAAVSESNQASAIDVAVSAGAKVIALGGYIDPARPAVASAIQLAVGHNVVVVTGAPMRSSGGSDTPARLPTLASVLKVGAINIDGAVATTYEPGSVDVVAPGVGVAGLGISGTGQFVASGTQYAVAFVAGQVALVRAMYPNLTAAQVVRRIEATADRMGSTVPDATFGWGLINPGVAVTRVIADEGRSPDPPSPAASGGWSSLRTKALAITVAVALVLVLLLALRIRRMVRPAPMSGADAGADPTGGGGLAATSSTPPVAGALSVAGAAVPVGARSDSGASASAGWDRPAETEAIRTDGAEIRGSSLRPRAPVTAGPDLRDFPGSGADGQWPPRPTGHDR